MNRLIASLMQYGKAHHLYEESDAIYVRNRLLHLMREETYEQPEEVMEMRYVSEVLDRLCDLAVEKGIIEDTLRQRDAFDSALMDVMIARPSFLVAQFDDLYRMNPEKATDEFYRFSKATNYIRMDRVSKNICYQADTEYGRMDITINLSKPEKDPKDIAQALKAENSSYPACVICKECEGYYGGVNCEGRSNHRMIPLRLNGRRWFLQYSPYVYYNEHCIVLNEAHTPMRITRETFMNLFAFVRQFPHYFIGSNADLPIVGGSILSHDHYQGGNHTFAMTDAEAIESYDCFEHLGVRMERLRWPLTVLRLSGRDHMPIIDAACQILDCWREYSDEVAGIIAVTDAPHNTITPIARFRDGRYELDLVLRNNLTSEEHPLGIFHPHEEIHHIKKENIGLIEVMGLAVLPARLDEELKQVKHCVLNQPYDQEMVASHMEWVGELTKRYRFHEHNAMDILYREAARVFVRGLEHCAVFPLTDEGMEALRRFTRNLTHESRQ